MRDEWHAFRALAYVGGHRASSWSACLIAREHAGQVHGMTLEYSAERNRRQVMCGYKLIRAIAPFMQGARDAYRLTASPGLPVLRALSRRAHQRTGRRPAVGVSDTRRVQNRCHRSPARRAAGPKVEVSVTDQIANFDIIACLRADGRHEVKQMTPGGHLILLREGPFDAAHAARSRRAGGVGGVDRTQ